MPDPPDSLHMVDSSQYEQQQEELLLEARMADIRRKLLVLSGKGGVGKSTVAANLAAAQARARKRVGLLSTSTGPASPS
jgi:ATP-binding protein involved in chromosome partitioning